MIPSSSNHSGLLIVTLLIVEIVFTQKLPSISQINQMSDIEGE